MITLLTGENTFEIEQNQRQIIADFNGIVEQIDGSELSIKNLPDLLMGSSLFADKRLVIIKNLSENKTIWADFADWLSRLSDDIELVLIEPKLDKRTLTYKQLNRLATIIEYELWSNRDETKAIKWVSHRATEMNIKLNTKSVQLLIKRVGIDQWALFHALEKLSLIDNLTDEIIELIVELNPTENVFNLLDAALRGNRERVSEMVKTFELTEDPYRIFALLSSQVFQLAAIAFSLPSDAVAKDLSANPYALSKLTYAAKKLLPKDVKNIVNAFAAADDDMKISRAEPWLLIERALMQLS